MNVNEVKTEEQAKRFLDEQERLTQNTALIARLPAELKRYATSAGVAQQVAHLAGSSGDTPIYFLSVKTIRENQADLILNWFVPARTAHTE